MEPILKTTNLCKSFGGQKVVSGVSLCVEKNSVYGLLGPNGAGKSTILKMIAGMLRSSSGMMEFDGHSWSRKDLEHIGALIETPPLYDNLTAEENLEVRTTMLGLPRSRIREALEMVDLTDTELRRLIRSFPGKGMTVIVSSHILSEVEQVADHIGILTGGVLGYSGKINPGEDLEQLFFQVIRGGKQNAKHFI